MKKMRAIISKNIVFKRRVIKLVRLKNSYMAAFFYVLKIFFEVTTLILTIPFVFFLRSKYNNTSNNILNLFLIGKNVENLQLKNFDYYHLEKKLKKHLIENFQNQNFVEFFFDDKSLNGFFKRHILLFSHTDIKILTSSWSPYAKSISHPSKFYFYLVHWLSRNFTLTIIGWDSVSSGFWKKNVINEKWVSVKVTENPNLIGLNKNETYKCRIETILMPINIYNPSPVSIKDRKYDVFFSGKINSYRDYRRPYIESIKSLKINSFVHEIATVTDLLSYKDLYVFLGNSKIGVNFSKSIDENEQLKGRVWETLLCGALLLEQENSQITNYFTPDIHYVAFSSSEDLASKIVFYLNHPSELKRIAEAGTAKALSLQSTLHF